MASAGGPGLASTWSAGDLPGKIDPHAEQPRLDAVEGISSPFAAPVQGNDVECVASHFVVCGLAPGLLEPNAQPPPESWVLDAVCTVAPSRGETVPEGFTLLDAAVSGQRAAVGVDGLLLAYRLRPLLTLARARLAPALGVAPAETRT